MINRDAVYQLHNWLNGFLRVRGLETADKRPLYAYRITSEEMAELEALLSRCADDVRADAGRSTTAAYVLYASEAFRSKHIGGAWQWATIENPVGINLNQIERSDIVRQGLKWWGRPLRQTAEQTQYLFSMVVEGGFPEALIHHENASVRRWLAMLLADAEKYGLDASELEEVASQHARSFLPESLRHPETHHLGAEIVAVTRSLRECLGRFEEFEDPILLLNQKYPGWEDQLPVRLSDHAARELVRGLVRLRVADQGGGTLGAFIQRVLRKDSAGCWCPAIRMSLVGEVSLRRLPDAIRAMVDDDVLRIRLQGSGALGNLAPGELSIGDRREDDRWSFRLMRSRNAAVSLPIEIAVKMIARVGNRVSSPFVVPGGEGLDSDVLVFLKDDETGELVYAGSGSVRSRASSVWVVFDRSAVSIELEQGAPEPRAEEFQSSRYSLLELFTPTIFEIDGGFKVRVVPGSQNDQRRRLIVLGKSVPQLSSQLPISHGWPSLIFEGGINVPNRLIRWRPAGRRQEWRALERSEPPEGAIDVAVVGEDGLAACTRIVVLPEHFRLERRPSGPRQGSLRFSGLQAAEILIEQAEDLTVDRREVDGVQELAISSERVPPALLTIDIRFPTGSTGPMWVTFPGSRHGFIDADGDWIEQSEVRFRPDQLAGLRASAPTRTLLFARLLAGDLTQRTGFDAPVEGLVSVAALQSEFEGLFSQTSDLDARISLELENSRIELARFDLSFEPISERTVYVSRQSIEKLLDEAVASITIFAADLTDFLQAPDTLALFSSADAIQAIVAPSSASPLLLWGEINGRPRFRPVVIAPHGEHARMNEPFVTCALKSYKRERLIAMAEHLDRIAADPLHPDWNQLDGALRTFQGKLPLAVLDWFVAFAGHSRGMASMLAGRQDRRSIEAIIDIENELPVCWSVVPIDDWVAAFLNCIAALSATLEEHGVSDPGHIATQFAAERLVWLVGAAPCLYATIAVVSQKTGISLPPQNDMGGEPISLGAECQAVMRRNSDRTWPAWPEIDRDIEIVQGLLPDVAPHMIPVLAAPFAAAHHAVLGTQPTKELVWSIRDARRFDQTFFDRVYPLGILREVFGIEIN